MPLVQFTPEKIKEGYKSDVDRFNGKNQTAIENRTIITTLDQSTADIKPITENITNILTEFKKTLTNVNYNWDDFEYSHHVPELITKSNTEIANKLWGLRHALCFQLIIYTYYKSSEKYNKEELNTFKLGIFGSVNPTSDIDIGFQYSKKTERVAEIIADVVETFEDAFIELTEKYSLGYDIEPYADMMYLDDEQGLFYCDSTDFENKELLQIMPAVGASIIRNVVQSQIDINPSSYEDVRRYKTQTKQSGGTVENIKTLINNFNFDDINIFFSEIKNLKLDEKGEIQIKDGKIQKLDENDKIQIDDKILQIFSDIFNNNEWQEKAKKLAIEYMTKAYNDSRKIYYSKVKEIEKFLKDKITFDRDKIIDKQTRVDLMSKIAEALVFRAESYVSPSTVMHIVRVYQDEEPPPEEGCENLTIKKSKAQCSLGKMGYVMSCMEQIGYLYRFNQTYCKDGSHKDEAKCKRKYNKYYIRLIDGIKQLNKMLKPQTGGRHRRRYSKKNHKKMKTRKVKNISKRTKRIKF